MLGFHHFPSSEHTGHRFGFNGMEKDDEVHNANGSSYTTDFRQLDPRLGGRWWSLDPIVKPWESPYAGFSNNPIYFIDPSGLDPGDPYKKGDEQGDKGTEAPNGGTRDGEGGVTGGENICKFCGENGEDIYGLPDDSETSSAGGGQATVTPDPSRGANNETGYKYTSQDLDARDRVIGSGNHAITRALLARESKNRFRPIYDSRSPYGSTFQKNWQAGYESMGDFAKGDYTKKWKTMGLQPPKKAETKTGSVSGLNLGDYAPKKSDKMTSVRTLQ